MYTYDVGVSQNGRRIYARIINSVAGRYFSRQPYVVRLVNETLATRSLTEPALTLSQDMGRVIGNTNIVATEETDKIFYACLPKQTVRMRFVKNRSMEPSSELSIILRQDENGDYEVTNVWIGPLCPPFPDAVDAPQESTAYWQSHALTANSEQIDLQTVTSDCPY